MKSYFKDIVGDDSFCPVAIKLVYISIHSFIEKLSFSIITAQLCYVVLPPAYSYGTGEQTVVLEKRRYWKRVVLQPLPRYKIQFFQFFYQMDISCFNYCV